MKTISLIILLFFLASCGGGKGSSGNSTSRSQNPVVSMDCFEGELHWLETPPETTEMALKSMQESNFEKCEGIEAYSVKVKKAHPQLNF